MATNLDQFIPFAGQTLADADWRSYFKTVAPDGVVPAATNTMLVAQNHLGANLSVDVPAGQVIVQGDLGVNSTVKNLTIGANNSGQTRLDLVVARLVTATPAIVLDVLAGTPGSGVFPALTQSGSTWEIPLAGVTVANGASSIVNANIQNAQRYFNSGTGGNRYGNGVGVASNTLALYFSAQPNIQHVVVSGGGGAITSLPAGPAGSILLLEFAGSGSITAGSNLKMPRNLTAQNLTTILFHSDGTNWIEDSRANEPFSATQVYIGPTSGSSAAAPTPRALATLDLPTNPTVAITNSVSGTTVNTGSATAVTFNQAFMDNASQWNNATPTRITCQQTGYYWAFGTVAISVVANAGDYTLALRKNGTNTMAVKQYANYPAHASTILKIDVSGPMLLTASDYLELIVTQTTGANLTVTSIGGGTSENSPMLGMFLASHT